ncbi:uncharacterized protein [Apostichopus japonicus]|uniref:uncharacterized protein isoform X1 n=1 Tax=Stichopus japonicus TaxID=307972 RepID=UPI003AB72E6F
MKANTIIAKLILAILSILSLLVCEILSDSVLSREELAACIYWNDFDIDRCIAGYYKCESSGSGCCPCQQGSFMTWFNKCSQCLPFRDCLGNEILFEGNYRNDRVCGDLRSTTVSTPTETTVSLSSSSSPDLAIDLTTEGSIYSIIDEGNPWLNFDIVTALSLVTMISISCVIGCMVWMTYKWKCKTQGPCTCQCEACQGCMGASSTHESAHSLDSITSENPDPPTTDTKSPADMELLRNRKRSSVAIPVLSQFTMPTKQTEANHYIKE